jgi:hypothetical protein
MRPFCFLLSRVNNDQLSKSIKIQVFEGFCERFHPLNALQQEDEESEEAPKPIYFVDFEALSQRFLKMGMDKYKLIILLTIQKVYIRRKPSRNLHSQSFF